MSYQPYIIKQLIEEIPCYTIFAGMGIGTFMNCSGQLLNINIVNNKLVDMTLSLTPIYVHAIAGWVIGSLMRLGLKTTSFYRRLIMKIPDKYQE